MSTEIKGSNGTISFDGQTVTITRKGLGAALMSGARGTKTLPLSAITAVQYKKAGMTVGYLQLSVPGDTQRQGRNATHTVQQDENTVTFYAKQNAEFEALASSLNAALLSKSAPVQAAPDLADQIGKLAALRDQGILSEDEFNAKKAELLARL